MIYKLDNCFELFGIRLMMFLMYIPETTRFEEFLQVYMHFL
jgi:hypothetical protein